jgi:site-specific DNA recombinase
LLPSEQWIPVATVPAIVTQFQFDQVQSKLAKNRSFAQRNNTVHPYLLRALVSCGHCQLACIGRKLSHSPYSYYVCSQKSKKAVASGYKHCPSRFAPAGQLDELVWADLCHVLTHPAELTKALERAHGGHWLPQQLQQRQANLRKGRDSLRQQLDRLTEAYLHDIIPLPEYERRRRELEQRGLALAEQEQQLCAQAERHEEVASLAIGIEDFCKRVQTGLMNANFEQKRKLIELLIDRVIVTDDNVEIRYVIPTAPHSEHIRFCHLRTDYFRTPHRIWSLHGYAAQQIRIHLVLRMLTACVRPRRHPRQSHRAHESLHPLAVDDMPEPAQVHHHAPTAVKRPSRVFLVNQSAQQQIFFILFELNGPAIHACP